MKINKLVFIHSIENVFNNSAADPGSGNRGGAYGKYENRGGADGNFLRYSYINMYVQCVILKK